MSERKKKLTTQLKHIDTGVSALSYISQLTEEEFSILTKQKIPEKDNLAKTILKNIYDTVIKKGKMTISPESSLFKKIEQYSRSLKGSGSEKNMTVPVDTLLSDIEKESGKKKNGPKKITDFKIGHPHRG